MGALRKDKETFDRKASFETALAIVEGSDGPVHPSVKQMAKRLADGSLSAEDAIKEAAEEAKLAIATKNSDK